METLYDNVSYTFDETKRVLCIKWDKNNTDVSELMNREIEGMYNKTAFTNLSFIEVVKDYIQLEEPQTIYIKVTPSMSRCKICIEILENPFHDNFTFLELNENGYLYLKEFDGVCVIHADEEEFTTHKINCIYNDTMYSNEHSVILK